MLQSAFCPSRSLAAVAALLTALAVAPRGAGRALPQTQTLRGEVLSDKNSPLVAAVCSLSGRGLPPEGLSVTTDAKGKFEFPGLMAGTYTLTCAADGYEPISERDLKVGADSPPMVQLVLPAEITVRQRVEVHGQPSSVAQQQSAPPTRLESQQLMALPLVQQKFKAALPLVPGVIRTPDGRINIKGTGENNSLLLLDSAEMVDPVTGSFSIDVPVVAIESLSVSKTTYRTEAGGFSGGITSIETRPPSERWRFEMQDITPNPRIKSGHLVGIADFNPKLYFSGPLLPNRLNFSAAVVYDVDKQPVRGLAWPHNEIRTEDFNSFAAFQYVFSPQHLMTANVIVFPLRRQFANINSLVPQPASSNYGQRGFSVGVTDRYLLSSGGIFTALVQGTQFDSDAYGQGPAEMLVTPDGWAGNFFNKYNRTSSQIEVLPTYEFPQQNWHGKHALTVGGDFVRRAYTGSSDSHPVLLLRADGTAAERIDFTGPGSLAAKNVVVGLFAQDHWTLSDRLALDAGVRYSGESLGEALDIAPRLGAAYSLGGGKTILRAGAGVFNDRVPLLAGDFTGNPTRTLTFLNEQGMPAAPPLMLQNRYLRRGDAVPTTQRLDNTPLNVTWSAEADHQFRPNVVLRLSYLSSRTFDQFIVSPLVQPGITPALVLSDSGGTRYHEFEATVHVRPGEDSEFNISYVHSRARGDLNTLEQVFVPFEQPVIRPNFPANLASDIPNRLITWGRFKTHVWGIIVGPLLDLHTGFPYSTVDPLQNYVGEPNSHRLPGFFSLDLKLGREFRLPLPWLKNHVLRGYLTIINLTDHSNPRDVYNNIASPFFGHFVGFQHRSFDTDLAIAY